MPKQTPTLINMLEQLVGSMSVSSTSEAWDSSNREVIDLLAAWLDGLGFETHIQVVNEKKNKANLIATLGKGSGGLVLSGHTDTVPFDESLWQTNPLAITEVGNKLFGLGSTDMKGFFPIAIEAAKSFIDKPLKHPLIILATCDEESSMDGARALARANQSLGRFAVIGEPTDLKPIRVHKGVMMEAITVTGRSGHSSNPALGNSALEAMTVVMTDLMQFRHELQEKNKHPMFEVPVPTMNLGCIHGGDNPNRICGECELHFDLRPLPGMTLEELRQSISNRLTPIAHQLGVNISLRPLMPGVAPFEQDADSELVKIAEQLTGNVSEAVSFGTEAPFLQSLGMETIVMGPGSIDCAHQPDEFLPTQQIRPAIELLEQLIDRFCRQ